MDGSTSLSRAWVLSLAIVVGLGVEASAAEVWSWPRVAWRRAASFATPAEDQVAAAERVLRAGMTQDEALRALDGKITMSFGTSLLDIHHRVQSRRFRKAEIWLTFRWRDDPNKNVAPAGSDETAEADEEVLRGSYDVLETWTICERE